MSKDINEIVRSLKNCANSESGYSCSSCDRFAKDCVDVLMRQAADAIEELIAALTASNEVIARSKPKWIKFKSRPLTEEEKEEHPEWVYIMDCKLPDDGQEIFVSNGRYVWTDTFYNDADGCYLDGDSELEGKWWMPLPEPPKEDGEK